MYAVVAAAKALYEQLGEMGESSIDGDSFLDLWIYVIIKAGIKDLVSIQYIRHLMIHSHLIMNVCMCATHFKGEASGSTM